MKLFLQIALAVFIGNLASLGVMEYWRTSQVQKTAELEKQQMAEQQRLRDEQGAKIRQMLLNAHRAKEAPFDNNKTAPLPEPGFPADQ